MESVTVREVQHHFSRLLRRIEAGAEFRIVRRNRPVARLAPIASTGDGRARVDWSDLPRRVGRIWKGAKTPGAGSDAILEQLRGNR